MTDRFSDRVQKPIDNNALLRQIRNALFYNAIILTFLLFIVAGN